MPNLAFATPNDVADRWRSLSVDEERLAEVLLDDASLRVRARYPDVDARVTAGTLDAAVVTMVVAGMVKKAMLAGSVEGVTQSSETAGPFSQSRTYANPTGALAFTPEDEALLSGVAGRRVRSVRLVSYGDV